MCSFCGVSEGNFHSFVLGLPCVSNEIDLTVRTLKPSCCFLFLHKLEHAGLRRLTLGMGLSIIEQVQQEAVAD